MEPEQWLMSHGFGLYPTDSFIWKLWDYFIRVDVKSKSIITGSNESRMHQKFTDLDDMVMKIQREAKNIQFTVNNRVKYEIDKLLE